MTMLPSRSQFTKKEWRIIQSRGTPLQAQRFLTHLLYNNESEGETCRSFRGVVASGKAHCLEAAITAAVILEQHGYPPLVVSIESQDKLDHVLFLFRRKERYGAVARSRDFGLHGRRPVFRRVRDLVMSYFDPYCDMTGRITGYAVADLRDLGNYDWRFSRENVWEVERYLQAIEHTPIKSSDARYRKWHRRYIEFRKLNPTGPVDIYPNRDCWMF